jgi:hypothetical protein
MGGGAVVLLVVALPLWRENYEPGQPVWNAFLALMLVAIVIAAVLLQRFFMTHMDEIGEARFDNSNREDNRG